MRGVLLALAVVLLGTAYRSTIIPIHDMMPAFWQVVDSKVSDAERIDAFKKQVILPNLSFYSNGEFGRNLDDAAIAAYLNRTDFNERELRALSDRVSAELPNDMADVARALPGLSLDGVQVFVLPSFGHFNAQTHDIPGGIGVFFAPDGMLHYDGPNVDVAVEVAHEFFHIYQFQTHPGYNTSDVELWQAVWGEGSAAYASQRIAVNATRAQALGAELDAATPGQTAQLACFVAAHWGDRNGEEMEELIDAGAHLPNLPARGGYLVGYIAAQDFAKTHALAQIGSAPISEVEPAMKATVTRLCGR